MILSDSLSNTFFVYPILPALLLKSVHFERT
nr:MAG TPA: hypothetical protein [Caudoviricetes sp.]